MKAILALVAIASASAFQTPVPKAQTPEDAPISASKKHGPGNELEGVHASEDGVMSQAKYEGGSVAFKVNRVITYVNQQEVVIVQNKQRFGIPVQAIQRVLYGSGVNAQVAGATGDAIPAATGKPSANQTVAGIVWAVDAKKSGVVLRVDKGDFDGFMNALQAVTKQQAVNTDAGK